MLDAKVVITTNFDKIYEGYCHSFAGSAAAYKTISYRQDDLADEFAIGNQATASIRIEGSAAAIGEFLQSLARSDIK
jgi:hypothetical protein